MNEMMKILYDSVVQGLLPQLLGWFVSTILERYKKKKNQSEVFGEPQIDRVEKKVSFKLSYSKTVSHKKNEK